MKHGVSDFPFTAQTITRFQDNWELFTESQNKNKKLTEETASKIFWNGDLLKIQNKSKQEIIEHYENLPIQIYWKFYHPKKKIFR